MSIQDALIAKLGHEAIAKINPKEAIELLLGKLKEAVAKLDGDADGDGQVDRVEILADIAVIGEKAAHVAYVLEAANKKK